jgi:hypothetical protein
MNNLASEPKIPESFLEHQQLFSSDWVDRWTIPNPFISLLFSSLRSFGVELTDFSFSKDVANVGDSYLNIAVHQLNSAVRVGLDRVTYVAQNPDWGMALRLVELFDGVSTKIQKFVGNTPESQQVTLAFHVIPGTIDLGERTAQLVTHELLAGAKFYGLSLHYERKSVVIDKSLRYTGAAFIRLQRTFDGSTAFADIAPELYEDEVSVLKLLGISGLV